VNAIRKLFAATLFLPMALPVVAAPITGRVNILWDKPQQIQLVPYVKLYPGESADLVASDQVDVDHQFGERRRCKWFGLSCWYEQWDTPHWVPASGFDIELVPDDGSVVRNGTVYHLTIPLSAGNANFTSGANLNGMLWLDAPRRPPGSRGPCIGRPALCSGGDLTLTLTNIDVTARLNALEARLANLKIDSLDVPAVTSKDSIDSLLAEPTVATEASITRLANMLARTCERLRGTITDKQSPASAPLHLKVIDLASFALGLARKTEQDTATLRIVITESLLDRGDYASATQEAPAAMNSAKSSFQANPDAKNALLYARAMKASAAAWREKKARNASSDIRVSIALLDQATDVLWDYTQFDGVSNAISDINVDAARMLNLLRTVAELTAAEQRLVTALCFQMHAEQGKGKSFDSWRGSVNEPTLNNCRTVRRTPI
jgi:hypothetical protein